MEAFTEHLCGDVSDSTLSFDRAKQGLVSCDKKFTKSRSADSSKGVSCFRKNMKVLIVSDTFPPDINGVARTLEALARGLAVQGHRVEIITTTDGSLQENARHGVAVRRVRSVRVPGYTEARAGLVSARWLKHNMETFRPDAIYVAVETLMGLNAIRAARLLGIPVVSGFHTNFHSYADNYHVPFIKTLAARFMRYVHNRTSRTLTPSHSTAEQLRVMGVNNVGVLGRGVNTSLFNPERRDTKLRAEWGVADDEPVAIFVGRIAAEKNLPLAVKVMQRLLKTRPGARGVFVGSGPKAEWLRHHYPQFIFAGACMGEDLARHYASADVFVFPSTTETYGNVLPEALASGLVTVSYDYAAASELIAHGRNGFMATYRNEDAFLSAAAVALDHWDDAPMRAAARASVIGLSWDAIIAQFERELMSAGREKPDATTSCASYLTASV